MIVMIEDDESDVFDESPKRDDHKQQRSSYAQSLAKLMAEQRPVDELHNQNKKSGIAGSRHNAFRALALPSDILKRMAMAAGVGVNQSDGCRISSRITKRPGKDLKSRKNVNCPRGVEFNAKERRRLGEGLPVLSISCFHLVLIANGNLPPTSEHEASHRCHFPLCVNPNHLIWETHKQNVDREQCRSTRLITCPCPCNHTFSICDHNPSCIHCTCQVGDTSSVDDEEDVFSE
jgi:hypothetical protein